MRKMANESRLCVKSVIRGYHVYKDEWTPDVGDGFDGRIDKDNRFDRYTVAVIVSDNVVGHVPREISKIVYYFLKNGGEVKGVVTGKRQRSAVHMKGLEVPCIYEFAAHPTKIKTAAKLFKKADCILLK